MRSINLILFFLIPTFLQAQAFKFGDVPKEHLEMEVYDKDSSASAVVLFSKGESELSSFQGRYTLKIKRHIRIKVLTDEGLVKGDISIPFRNKKSNIPQNISKLKAESYIIESNGKIVKESVGRRDRFEEEVSETRSELKFTIPGLKKGSVFEYSYELTSDYPLDFPTWIFQDDIPVIWSEYRAKIPRWFRFLTVTKGYHDFFINESEEYESSITIPGRQERISNGSNVSFRQIPGSLYKYTGTEYHYVMRDIPALKDEPYMKSSIDYLSHVRFQISSAKFRESIITNYTDNWVGLVNRLLEDEDYGARLESSKVLDEAVSNAVEESETDLEKMIAIFNHVSKTTTWDERYRLYTYKNLKEVYEEGTGNSSAINLILIQMLRKAGLQAYPLILSTRTNGEIIPLFPVAGQFNHTIAYVQFEDGYYLLDAKNESRPYNLLPAEVLNGEGLIIIEDQVIWVPIENQLPNNQVNVINIFVNENGYSGDLISKNKGFYAVNNRSNFDFEDLNGSVNDEVFDVVGNFEVDSVSIIKDKLDESFDYKANFRAQRDSSENMIYFNPMITGRLTENPFKLKNRTFPIDFNYTFNESIIMNILVPEGWSIDEMPQSVLYRLPGQSGEFRRIVQNTGNKISMNYKFRINKKRFMPDEYGVVKQFYGQMVEMLAQNIVLKKES